MADAVARLWPQDCDDWVLPHAVRGQGEHLMPFPNYPGTAAGSGRYHLTPLVACLDGEYAIVVTEQTFRGPSGSNFGLEMLAYVVHRDGLDLTSGPVTVVESNGTFFYGNRDIDLEVVDDTHALVFYAGDTGADQHRATLLRRDGMNVSVVDQETIAATGSFAPDWFDISRIPGTSRFLASSTEVIYAVDVSGDTISVATRAMPAADLADTKVAGLDGVGRFLLWGYPGGGDANVYSGRLNPDLSIDWGDNIAWSEHYIHRNAAGSTDPRLISAQNGSAIIFYRALAASDLSGLGCADGGTDQARIQRFDVASDLSITEWAPVILDGAPKSSNIAPMDATEVGVGEVAVVYDVVHSANETFAAARIKTSTTAPGGLVCPAHANTMIEPGQLFWGAAIGHFTGKYFLVAQVQGGGVLPSGNFEQTFNYDTDTEINPPQEGPEQWFHEGTGVFVVELGGRGQARPGPNAMRVDIIRRPVRF